MTSAERLAADFSATALMVGPHPMALHREAVRGATVAAGLAGLRHGQRVTIAGMVICRQRPGTANGHVFISLEDETGISNAFVPSSLFEARRLVITQEPFLRITGRLQVVDNVTTVYAMKVDSLPGLSATGPKSHDFQ